MIYNFFLVFILIFNFLDAKEISSDFVHSSPYSLSKNAGIWLNALGMSLLYISEYSIESNPLTEKEIINLDYRKIPSYDYSAIKNWDPKSTETSDWLLYISLTTPSLLFLDSKIRKDIRTIMPMITEAYLINLGVTNLSKALVKRPRPYLYNEDVSIAEKNKKDNNRSFFSGHTSMSAVSWILFASIYKDYNPKNKYSDYLSYTAYMFPLMTAYYRYDAGKHFLSDIVIGYAVGAYLGNTIPSIHKKNKNIKLSPTAMYNNSINFNFLFLNNKLQLHIY